MKFVSVTQAKGIEIHKPVYTLNDKGEYGLGRLISRSETAKGTELSFEVATFTEEGQPPAIKATVVSNITHVSVIKKQNGE